MRQVLVAACVLAATSRAFAAPSPLEKPALTATPAELLAAAAKAPAGNWPVVVLREEYIVSLDDKGRVSREWRRIYVIRNQAGIDGWNDAGTTYRPFYQDKPTIRARVIAPDGSAAPVDVSTMSDSPVNEQSSQIYSDSRQINAPLPRLRVGSVVEEDILTTDRQALLGTSGSSSVYFGDSVPTLSTHVVLSAPSSAKPAVHLRGLGKLAPKHELHAGRDAWTIDRGVTDPMPDGEPGTPSDVATWGSATISTEQSWQTIGSTYRAIVETKLSDGPATLPPSLPTTPTIETAKAIVAWVHEQIRYTGIEFGEASHIPGTPAQTMQRGFGDCKDKATLIVSLLRQVGVPAELALLRDGVGEDIDSDIPSMNAFDHVIVRARIDGKDVWIDGTEDLYQAGSIPVRDQGRRVLVLDAKKSDLVLTPRFVDSNVHEVRTYTVPQDGKANIAEVIENAGYFDVTQRDWLRSEHGDDLKKSLDKYVSDEFGTKGVDKYTVENIDDLAKPSRLTTYSNETPNVFSSLREVTIYLYPSSAVDRVTDYIKAAPDANNPRRNDYVWTWPHTHVVENRIVLPAGFTPPAPVAPQTRKLGTTTLTEERRVEGQTLIVQFRFDSGKQRISAAETTDLRKQISALFDEGATKIVITHDAFAKTDQRDARGALEMMDREIAAHPKEAVHHLRRAAILSWVGAAPAARRELKIAATLEPKSFPVEMLVGYYSRLGDFGAEWGPGFDRATALAAYAKCMALDPKSDNAAKGYAEVLERSASGELSDSPADLTAAAKAWATGEALSHSWAMKRGLIRVLLRQRKMQQAEELARAAPVSAERDGLLAAAIVFRDPDAAVAIINGRAGDERQTAMNAIVSAIRGLREYKLLADLQVKLGAMSATDERYKQIARMTHSSSAIIVGKDPAAAVTDILSELFDPSYRASSFANDDVRKDFVKAYRHQFESLDSVRVEKSFYRDFVRFGFQANVSAATKNLWRVELVANSLRTAYYVTLVGGHAKVIGGSETVLSVGKYAMQLLAKNDRATARELMNWLAADIKVRNSSSQLPWGSGVATDDDTLDVAIATMARGAEPAIAVPILTKCASTAPAARKLCDLTLSMALNKTKNWTAMEAHLKEWGARDPTSSWPHSIRIASLADQKRYTEAEAAYSAAIAKFPTEDHLITAGAELSVHEGKRDEAIARFEQGVNGSPSVLFRNEYGWLLSVTRRDLPHAFELVTSGLQQEPANAPLVNTRAAIEVEQGDFGAAIKDLTRSMRLNNVTRPQGGDVYVLGLLYERLGLIEDAIDAYKRVDGESDDPLSERNLAKEHLAALASAKNAKH